MVIAEGEDRPWLQYSMKLFEHFNGIIQCVQGIVQQNRINRSIRKPCVTVGKNGFHICEVVFSGYALDRLNGKRMDIQCVDPSCGAQKLCEGHYVTPRPTPVIEDMEAWFYPCLFQDVLSRREEVTESIAQCHEFKMELCYRLIHRFPLLGLS